MSYLPGISQVPGAALENTIKPVADTAAALQIQQHSSGQSGPLLSFYDAAGTTFLGGVGPNASAVWKGLALNVTPRTANYTTLGTDYYIPVDATAGAVTVTLKPSTGTPFGSQQRVAKVDSSANAVTVQRGGADTINGGTSITLTSQYDTAVLQSDGNGAWNAVLPASLTPAVILTPTTSARNLIQPTADSLTGLTIKAFSASQAPGSLFLVKDGSNSPYFSVDGSGKTAVQMPNQGDNVIFEVNDNQASGLNVLQVLRSGLGAGYGLLELYMNDDTDTGIQIYSHSVSQSSNLFEIYQHFNPLMCWIDGNGALYLQPPADSGKALVLTAHSTTHTAPAVLCLGVSSTSTNREQFDLTEVWANSTDATRKARAVFNIWDTAAREALRLEASGSAAMLGFFGAPAVVRPASTDDLRQALINLGLYTTGGASPMDLNGGSLTAAGLRIALAAKTANYTLVDADHTVTADATGGAFTVTLPTASGRIGKQFTIKRINSGANAVTLQGNGAETIDGSNTQSLSAQWQSFTVEASTSTTWIIV